MKISNSGRSSMFQVACQAWWYLNVQQINILLTVIVYTLFVYLLL